MQEIKKIGIFDSGVGGLSILKSLLDEIGFESIIYYGDTARMPYGNKDSKTITRFCLEALEFFKNFNIDLLVLACNTASAHALKSMQQFAEIPIVGVIESGVHALSTKHIPKQSHILVIATTATIASAQYERELKAQGYHYITNIATNLLVSLVEENIFSGNIVSACFEHYFNNINPDVVILGCTHFPLLLDALQGYFGINTLFIHSGEAIAHFLLHNFNIIKNPKNNIEFFASDNVDKLKHTAKQWLTKGSYRIQEH